MSMLTTSPSPAASPRASYHIQTEHQRQRYSSSSLLSNPSSSSPKLSAARHSPRTFITSSPRKSATNARGSVSSPLPNEDSSGVKSEKEARGRFVDVGTQYSPEGYPPTAFSRDRKRKELAGPHTSDKVGAHMAATAVSAQAPSEPLVRMPPSESTPPPEPQEARSTSVGTIKRQRPGPGQTKIMPRAYETCDPKELGVLISNMLMELIRLNDQIPLRDGRLTRFHSRAPPGISVSDYLQRLIQHATLSPPILLSMVYYIDRLCQLYAAFTINSLTVHRFLITAATVAAKGLSDSFWTNPTYARIGGIPVSELATLELEFLQKVQWKIVPKPETLVDYYNSLLDRTEGYELEPSEADSNSSEASPAQSGMKDDNGRSDIMDEAAD